MEVRTAPRPLVSANVARCRQSAHAQPRYQPGVRDDLDGLRISDLSMSCVYVQQRTEWKDTSWTWLSGGFKQELLCQIDNGIGQQDLEVVVVDRVVLRPRQTGLGCYGDDTVVGLVHQRAAAAG
jgi:hypothetical protein